MSVTNNAVLYGFSNDGQTVVELVPGPAATQNTATRINNEVIHVLKSVSTGSLILPSILSGEANEVTTVVNDTLVAVNVYPAVGEKMQSGTNTPFSVTAGNSAIFFPVVNSVNNYPSTLNWCAGLITG